MKRIIELKKYTFLVAIFIVILVCLLKKDSYLETPIVSNPDTQISFTTQNIVLEQTWMPHVKKIAGISIPYVAKNNFDASVNLKIYTDEKSDILLDKTISHSFVENEENQIQFQFETTDVNPGERLRIQLSYKEFSKEGEILVEAGSNYLGCSIDEESMDVAAAFDITFIKNSRLFWLFSVVFPWFAFSFLGMVLWKRKWEDVIGLSCIISIVPMYVLGLFDRLVLGINVTYILAVIALGFASYIYIKKEIKVRDLISPGLIVWGIFFVLILVSCQGVWLARSDEYTHWGLAVKDMFYYDSFAKHYNTTVLATRYMPFSTLIEYLMVFLNGLFGEDLLYVGFQLLLLNILTIILQAANKNLKYILPSVFVILFIPVIFFYDVSQCLYVDPLLAVLGAYVLICYYSEKESILNYLRILGGLFALVTSKDIGVAIAGLICLIIFADTLYRKLVLKENKLKISIFFSIINIVFILSVFMSWQIYMSIPASVPIEEHEEVSVNVDAEIAEIVKATESLTDNYNTTIGASGISVEKIYKILSGEGEEYQYKSIKNFASKLFDGDTYYLGNIPVSYMDISVTILLVIFLLGSFNYWKQQKTRMYSFGILSFIAGLGYCAFLELLYLCAFMKNEALSLASHERYLGSYLCAVVITFSYLSILRLAELDEGVEGKRAWIIAMCFSVIIFNASPIKYFWYNNRDFSITPLEKYGFNESEEVLRSFSNKSENIYFICSNSTGGALRMFQNSACPMLVPYREGNISTSIESEQIQKEIYTARDASFNSKEIISIEEWEKRLQNCKYVFILNADEMFKCDYADLFESPETIDNGTFYQVMLDDGVVKLHYIGQVSVKTYVR